MKWWLPPEIRLFFFSGRQNRFDNSLIDRSRAPDTKVQVQRYAHAGTGEGRWDGDDVVCITLHYIQIHPSIGKGEGWRDAFYLHYGLT